MKKALIPMCLAALLMLFSSCAAREEPTPSVSPSVSPTVSASPMVTTVPDSTMDGLTPEVSIEPSTGDDMAPDAAGTQPAAQGVTSLADARRVTEDIEDELERLSEVEDAQVIIAGHEAAVALKFDKQYQTGIDERLRKIVKERIDGIVSGVNNIAITQDETLMEQLKTLGERLEGAADMTDIENELDAIIQKINASKA